MVEVIACSFWFVGRASGVSRATTEVQEGGKSMYRSSVITVAYVPDTPPLNE